MAHSQNIKHFSDENFNQEIKKGVVLVDFYTDWCGPCQMLSPILEELAQEMQGKITVAKINTDQALATATHYDVTSIPTLILFKNGEVVNRHVGLCDLDKLKKMVGQAIA